MKPRVLLPFLVVAIPGAIFAQDKPEDVLAGGDPPLTVQMANDYMRFMQWSLRTPLTLGQESRIKTFLIDNWKADNKTEITRTLNLLELRKQLESMGLKESRWAAFQTGTDAVRKWRSNPNIEMSRWGLSLFSSSHTPLLKGWPTLYKQMNEAFEELGYFMLKEVDGNAPIKIDAVERAQLSDSLAKTFPQLTAEQKANFMDLPKIWVQLRTAWPTLDDTTKASLRTAWKAGFYPAPKPPAKGAKSTGPAPSSRPQPVINRLVKMTWVTSPNVFDKMKAVGTPYGLGW